MTKVNLCFSNNSFILQVFYLSNIFSVVKDREIGKNQKILDMEKEIEQLESSIDIMNSVKVVKFILIYRCNFALSYTCTEHIANLFNFFKLSYALDLEDNHNV